MCCVELRAQEQQQVVVEGEGGHVLYLVTPEFKDARVEREASAQQLLLSVVYCCTCDAMHWGTNIAAPWKMRSVLSEGLRRTLIPIEK